MLVSFYFFFFNDTATTEIYTYDTLFPYTTLFRSLSFTDFDIYALADLGNLRFVGFDNYIAPAHTPLFWKALGNTAEFVVLGVPLSIALSLGAALLVNSRVARWRGFLRTIYFAPVVTTLVAVALIWRYLFHRSEEHTSELQSLMRISY